MSEKLLPLSILSIEGGILSKGLLQYLADYEGTHFIDTELDDMIIMFQDVLTDIELGFKRLGINVDPAGD